MSKLKPTFEFTLPIGEAEKVLAALNDAAKTDPALAKVVAEEIAPKINAALNDFIGLMMD